MQLQVPVLGKQGRFNKAGFTIHSGVYKARPDANCAMHTHTRAGAGAAMLRHGLRPISQDSMLVLDDIVYHDYGMPATQEECDALGVSCQSGSCVVLRNHGLLTVGSSIAEAFLLMYNFESTCQIQIGAQAGGALTQVDPRIIDGVAQVMRTQTGGIGGAFAWPALLRKLDRLDTSYRE